MRDPTRLGSIMDKVFENLGLKNALSRHRIVQLWPKIVEPVVASHAFAEKVEGPVLYVTVDSSVWMNELSANKTVLLKKINSFLDAETPPITEIRFQQRSWARQAPPKVDLSESQEIDESDHRDLRKILEPIKDDNIKELLESILKKDFILKHKRNSP